MIYKQIRDNKPANEDSCILHSDINDDPVICRYYIDAGEEFWVDMNGNCFEVEGDDWWCECPLRTEQQQERG